VRRHVGELARAVAGRSQHISLADDDGADGNFPALAGGARLGERQIHECRPAPIHVAWNPALC
jgi:hypothetical protein